MKTYRSLLILGLLAARAVVGHADQSHVHDHSVAGDVGAAHFPTTCAAAVQPDFDRAVALLHSFGYELARQGFLGVAGRDPRCGMAWWGVAMTYYHPIWAPPTPEELTAGREAAAKAASVGATSERERAYIEAVGSFYRATDGLDHKARAQAYRTAVEEVARRFPDDDEAKIFQALSLLGTAPPADTTYAEQRRAAEILTPLIDRHPKHPGVAHYVIHSFDYPALAELALPAARAYAKIAPASPHAQHMPSHIFTRLGLWNESIASNLESERTADALVAKMHPGAASFDALHAVDYLVYAYLQIGEDAKARDGLQRMARATKFDEPNFAAGYALAAGPSRYALERHAWAEAAAIERPAAKLPWERFPYALASLHFARAIGGARSGDSNLAKRELAELESIHTLLASSPPAGPYDWAGQVESLRLAAAGWLAWAEKRTDEALALLRRAADLQDRVGKHPVTPGEVLPARELLADLLAEIGRPAEALAEYEADLASNPNRANGLHGAARAAKAAGETAKARAFRARLAAQFRRDTPRADVAEVLAASDG
jgi:tetratricopeptide (TPR) repeat protein